NVMAHTMGGDSSIFLFHTVLNHESTLIPVGIATAVVATAKVGQHSKLTLVMNIFLRVYWHVGYKDSGISQMWLPL
ncbi:MAG: hypothetical protein ACTS7I_02605, partial [Candidatus Hodgkinia cicadicola]